MIGFLDKRKHDRLRTLLSSFADDQVSEGEKRDVEAHLAQCPECQTELASIRGMSQLMGRLPEIALPRSFVLTQAPAPVQRPTYSLWGGSLATAAAAVLLVFLLVGDAVGLVTQSPTSFKGSVAQEAIAPAAAPQAAELRSASAPAAGSFAAEAPAAPAAAPAAAAPAPPMAAALAEKTDVGGGLQTEADSTQEMAAPAAAMALQAEPTPDSEVATLAEPAPLAPSLSSENTASRNLVVETPEPAVATRGLDAPETVETSSGEDGDQAKIASDAATMPQPAADLLETSSVMENQVGDENRQSGISLPLRQLQLAVGAALVILAFATIIMFRRYRR